MNFKKMTIPALYNRGFHGEFTGSNPSVDYDFSIDYTDDKLKE